MARILRLYVIREIALPTGLALLTITFLLLIGIVYEFISLLLQPTISVWSVAQMLVLLLPSTITFALPMAILIGALIGVGRMTLDREVLAMRASGINLFKIFSPALALALLVSSGILWASGNLVPVLQGRGMNLAAQLQFELMQSLEAGRFHTNLGSGGGGSDLALYFSERAQTPDRSMQSVVLKMEEDHKVSKRKREAAQAAASTQATTGSLASVSSAVRDNMLTMVFAERGEIQTRINEVTDSGQQGAAIILTLLNGTIHRLEPDPTEADNTVIRFEKLEKRLFTKTAMRKPFMTQTNAELKQVIAREQAKKAERKSGDKEKKYKVPARSELIERYALSLAFFVFALMAIPLAIWIKPSGKSWGIMLAIVVMLVYYVLLKIGSAMVEVGNPLGVMVAFSPNLLFTLLGAGLWWHNLKS